VEDVRRVLHLTRELGVNLAGVEVILEMRRKMEKMRAETDEKVEFLRQEMRREFERQQARKALVRVGRAGTVKKTD
jgi:MerR family transcriptional regulator/heat shock protein HspR